MWRPPERIRHALPAGGWPTRAEAERSLLCSSVRIGAQSLRRRTWVPAMVPWRATEAGDVTPEVLAWYERFAAGRPGAIVVEATGIRDVASGPLLRASAERYVPGLARLAEVVHASSGGETRVFVQLIDFLRIRRRPQRDRFLRQFLQVEARHLARLGADSEERARELLVSMSDTQVAAVLDEREFEALRMGARERVTDVHVDEIRDLPQVLPEWFAAAAERIQRAGFDGVELHYAHAYTMASFLSRRNDRADGWGGDAEGRLRLPLAVYDAVRARVGAGFVVGCRILGEECIAGGSTVRDAEDYAVRFAAAGMDFVSVSRGGKFEDAAQPAVGAAAYPYTGPSGYECMPTERSDASGPYGRNVATTARIRARVRDAGYDTPIVVAGGICAFPQAEEILRSGAADVIASARQSLADPDWFRKIELGRGEEVRRCKFTNYCEALDQRHLPVTCQLWDRTDLEAPDVPLTPDGRRRLVAPRWR